ncbi:uroporphyrinogen decarboxylase family protein [Desulfotruncus arcticus]|uniref:uroporphyrinogen decarboxylase family protein n=1 Tax=Desulfotruncus arcticus TaxID=341036 RepID=UPI0013F4F58B|nr:uroporphyrinogen decarboxylase family protein [Desulfotruncus arcticus]
MASLFQGQEMTGLERTAAVLSGKKPDRVPVCALFNGASRRVLGVDYPKWSTDPEECAESLIQGQKLVGDDALTLLIDLSVEAADFGQKVVYPIRSTAYSDTTVPVVKSVEDYYKIERINPRETPRMSYVLQVINILSKRIGKEVALCGFIYGPLGVLSAMRGHEQVFMDCLKKPDAVLYAEDVIADVLCEYAKAMAEAGCHALMLDTLYASQTIMRKKMWEKIEGEPAKKVMDAMRATGLPVTLHNCGNGIYFDAQQKWLDPVAISHAYPADDCKTWEEHAQKWGNQIITIGYVTPSEMALSYDYQQTMEACRQCIETFKVTDGKFILAPGCEYPPNGTILNAMAMVEAAKTYGVYK